MVNCYCKITSLHSPKAVCGHLTRAALLHKNYVVASHQKCLRKYFAISILNWQTSFFFSFFFFFLEMALFEQQPHYRIYLAIGQGVCPSRMTSNIEINPM